jgi:hypothetical protein
VKPRTEISVRFDISLSSLRYQERRVVPDDAKATGEDEFRPRSDEFIGVMPDYRTVIELTNAISADGYYVKTVVEDHPNRDPRDKTFKRGWDITGRWYEGVFPINFIISLRGTEPEDSVAGSAHGRTVAQVTVDGTFPNAEMKKKIEDKWEGLHARVTGLLEARAMNIGDPDPGVTHGLVTSSPPDVAAHPPAELSTPGLGNWDDEIVVPGKVVERRDDAVLSDRAGLAAELRRQRTDLRTLLAESDLIGERTYRGAIEDIRAELRYLERPDELLAGPTDHGTEAKVASLLRQRKGLRGKLIARLLSEDFYSDEAMDIRAELKDLGWSQ